MPVRFLCLHGYGQNAEVFRSRTGSLRRALKGLVDEFVFVDAPHHCTHFLPDEKDAAQERLGWYDWTEGPDGQRIRFGWEKSEAILLDLVDGDSQGGFDGILGFSQGAVAGSILCAKRPLSFRVAVLVAGGLPSDSRMGDVLKAAPRLNVPLPPSMHVYGEADQLIQPAKVLELAALWRGLRAVAWGHPGGHMVPSSKEFRNAVCAFVKGSLCTSDARASCPSLPFEAPDVLPETSSDKQQLKLTVDELQWALFRRRKLQRSHDRGSKAHSPPASTRDVCIESLEAPAAAYSVQSIIDGDAEVILFNNCFCSSEADALFTKIDQHPSWQKRPMTLQDRDNGSTFEALEGRPTIAFSVPVGKAYRYSGSCRVGQEFPPYILQAKERVEALLAPRLATWAKAAGCAPTFNYCLANKYENGVQYVGKHADDEDDIVPHSPIATLSLGATRTFQLEVKGDPSSIVRIALPAGSVLLMDGATQERYVHCIRKEKQVETTRISLTFRMHR